MSMSAPNNASVMGSRSSGMRGWSENRMLGKQIQSVARQQGALRSDIGGRV
jgi:hypothetical protein